jgi:hypothetical protein
MGMVTRKKHQTRGAWCLAASYVPVPPLMMLLLARLQDNGRDQVKNHQIEEYGFQKS